MSLSTHGHMTLQSARLIPSPTNHSLWQGLDAPLCFQRRGGWPEADRGMASWAEAPSAADLADPTRCPPPSPRMVFLKCGSEPTDSTHCNPNPQLAPLVSCWLALQPTVGV